MSGDWERVGAALKLRRANRTAGGSLRERLQASYGEDVDPGILLDAQDGESGAATGGAAGESEQPDGDRDERNPASSPSSELVKRLSTRTPHAVRYRLEGEIARDGMGVIFKVRDEDLRRTLAMKVILGKGGGTEQGDTPQIDSHALTRFLEEAQVTGQLDHPGIVPVHELGLDSDGRVYFTMKLVKGRDLKRIFDLVFQQKEGWNETRALSTILKVCEAMAYAHSKGVIHRDLKPANVMVGNFGDGRTVPPLSRAEFAHKFAEWVDKGAASP